MKVWKAENILTESCSRNNSAVWKRTFKLTGTKHFDIYWHHVQWLRHTGELISMISGGVSLCILMAVTWRAWICMCVFASVLPSQRARSRVSSGREPLTFVWIRSVSAQRETSCSLLETTQTLILFPLPAHLILWPDNSSTAESRAYIWEEGLFIKNKWIMAVAIVLIVVKSSIMLYMHLVLFSR